MRSMALCFSYIFQIRCPDRSLCQASHTILSLHFINSHVGKTKAYSACSCPDAVSCVVCREFFSIVVDYDAPSSF